MNSAPSIVLLAGFAMVMLFFLISMVIFVLLAGPWLRAFMHGAPVSIIQILAMRLRGNPPGMLLDAYISLKRAGDDYSIGDVESAYIDARHRVLTSDDLVEHVRKRKPMVKSSPNW